MLAQCPVGNCTSQAASLEDGSQQVQCLMAYQPSISWGGWGVVVSVLMMVRYQIDQKNAAKWTLINHALTTFYDNCKHEHKSCLLLTTNSNTDEPLSIIISHPNQPPVLSDYLAIVQNVFNHASTLATTISHYQPLFAIITFPSSITPYRIT